MEGERHYTKSNDEIGREGRLLRNSDGHADVTHTIYCSVVRSTREVRSPKEEVYRLGKCKEGSLPSIW
jgi:hypothetical protein